MNSRVHPKYKTKYRVSNWADYERGLVQRGDITIWLSPEAVAGWKPARERRRGGQRKYSDHAIETALALRLVFHLPLRQTEGFLTSVFGLMGVHLDVPDHTTLSRRGQSLDVQLRRVFIGGAIHLIVDSSGLSIVGEGEWAAQSTAGRASGAGRICTSGSMAPEAALVHRSRARQPLRASLGRSRCHERTGRQTPRMNSRVHPKYKTKYRVSNWAEYERGLILRGDITIWLSPEAVAAWEPAGERKRGGQRKYSDLAIETALTLRLAFHLPLRQTEGFLTSVFELMGVHLDVPDHTTLSRRSRSLEVQLLRAPANEPLHLIVDSSGLSTVGEGEWAAAKHGGKGKRGWKKLHLGVDPTGIIVAQVLTDGHADDAATVPDLLAQIDGNLCGFVADAAYDRRSVYDAAVVRGAAVIVPPIKTATDTSDPRCPAREATVARVMKVGRRRWKNESGYHRQGTVENAFIRYKSIIEDRLRARAPGAQETEARIACNILNRMFELGRPDSYSIGA